MQELMKVIARMLEAVQQGDPGAAEQLLPALYQELRRLAARKMVNEPAGHSLQPTALVHEAWPRLGADKTARTFSLQQVRQCAGFWWSEPGARSASNAAGNGNGSSSRRRTFPPRCRMRNWWRWMRHWSGWARQTLAPLSRPYTRACPSAPSSAPGPLRGHGSFVRFKRAEIHR